MKGNTNSLGTLALIATAALWGSNHVVARAARDAIPLPALVFWRWLPAAIILTIIALPALRDAWPAVRPRLDCQNSNVVGWRSRLRTRGLQNLAAMWLRRLG